MDYNKAQKSLFTLKIVPVCISTLNSKHRRTDITCSMNTAKYWSVATFLFEIGLIIDAFGELRDQQEQVREDMEVRSTLHFSLLLLTKIFTN